MLHCTHFNGSQIQGIHFPSSVQGDRFKEQGNRSRWEWDTFSIVCNWDKTSSGNCSGTDPTVQRSGTVAGSSLESMPFSSRAICWLWKEGMGWLLWMLGPAKCSQQTRAPGKSIRSGCSLQRESCLQQGPAERVGTQHCSSWALIEQRLGPWQRLLGWRMSFRSTKRGKCSGKLLKCQIRWGWFLNEITTSSDLLNFVTVALFLPFYLSHVKAVLLTALTLLPGVCLCFLIFEVNIPLYYLGIFLRSSDYLKLHSFHENWIFQLKAKSTTEFLLQVSSPAMLCGVRN